MDKEHSHSAMENDAHSEDVLAVSIIKLYSAQEAFQTEVQKLKDVGKEDDELGESSNSLEIKQRLNQNVFPGDSNIEFDEMVKRKMEIEVQYVAMLKAIEYHKVQIELTVESKRVVSEQMEMMKKLEDAEVKAIELKMQIEKLKVTCEEIREKGEVWEVRNMVCKLISLFCLQLILFVLLIFLFFSGV